MRINVFSITGYLSEAIHLVVWFMVLTLAALVFSPAANAAVLNLAYAHHDASLTRQVGWQQPRQTDKFQSAREASSDDEVHLSYRLLKPLAKQGHTIAQYQLALLHDGEHDAYTSLVKAAYWYEQAARNGHKDAQHNLAVAYANGEGVEQNINKALSWWKRAALAGHTDAQYNLGIIYATGKGGVQTDLVKAAKWWRQAAISGDAMAQYNLAALYANGVESIKSYCEATRWWEKASESGFLQASIALNAIKQKQDYQSCW